MRRAAGPSGGLLGSPFVVATRLWNAGNISRVVIESRKVGTMGSRKAESRSAAFKSALKTLKSLALGSLLRR